jgi:hypothetical protein
MTVKMYQRAGFTQTTIAALLVTLVSLINYLDKDLYVHETGNIKIFGGAGLLLATGLLLRWRYVRIILGILASISLFGLILITVTTIGSSVDFVVPRIILLSMLAFIAYLTLFSKAVKTYFASDA